MTILVLKKKLNHLKHVIIEPYISIVPHLLNNKYSLQKDTDLFFFLSLLTTPNKKITLSSLTNPCPVLIQSRISKPSSSPIFEVDLQLMISSRFIYISQFAASMNFQAQRPPPSPQEEYSIRELKTVLEGVCLLAMKEDQSNLLIVLGYLHKIIIKRFKDTKIPSPQQDENLTTSIYEKCLQIKKKNTELKISVLNLRAALRKMISGGCQISDKEEKYQHIVGNIRLRSEEVRAKLQKYRGGSIRPRLLANEDLRGSGVEELKRGAEWLQSRTIELRRQVQTLRNHCLNQYTHRD